MRAGQTSFDVTICPDGSDGGGGDGGDGGDNPNVPCSQWGWRFYDNYDIVEHDEGNAPAGHRNDCQDMCRGRAGRNWLFSSLA